MTQIVETDGAVQRVAAVTGRLDAAHAALGDRRPAARGGAPAPGPGGVSHIGRLRQRAPPRAGAALALRAMPPAVEDAPPVRGVGRVPPTPARRAAALPGT